MKCVLQNEFSDEMNEHYFKFTRQKFLHNIDTFYYSVTLGNDFLRNSEDIGLKRMNDYFKQFNLDSFDLCEPVNIPDCDEQINFRPYTFSGYYKYCLECPDRFDIFIAECVPTDITSQIIVQIRSCALWLMGVNKAFDDSYDVVQKFCKQYGFDIVEVKENRIDYCWHTNYIQRPDIYFSPQNFADMEVSRFKRIGFEYQLKKINNEVECDYIHMGKRSDKCFVRIYHKSKEVVEMGYKSWFFRMWYFNGLISMYDLYVYERLFILHSWKKIDVVRLQFYLEFGSDDFYKKRIKELIEKDTLDYAEINRLANILLPAITIVLNIEFQTTRKSSKSYCIIEYPRNSIYGPCKRIYDYLDNRRMITDYLTHSTLRLVNIKADNNKARAPYTDFWNSLRNTKQVDVKLNKHQVKLTRDYSRNLDKEVIKKRMCNAVVTLSLYSKGINEDDVTSDIIQSMVRLNDNDLEQMRRYKFKKSKLLNNYDFTDMIDSVSVDASLVDTKTGELIYDY